MVPNMTKWPMHWYMSCHVRHVCVTWPEHDHIIQLQPAVSADNDHDQPVKAGQNTTNSFTWRNEIRLLEPRIYLWLQFTCASRLLTFCPIMQDAVHCGYANKMEFLRKNWITFHIRVATKIFEGLGKALFKEFIRDREPVSIVHYPRPGTCIIHPLH